VDILAPPPKPPESLPVKLLSVWQWERRSLVGDNPANHELLTPGQDSYFCKMADPVALADAIRVLWTNPSLRKSLGENARSTFLAHASLPVISLQLKQIVDPLMA